MANTNELLELEKRAVRWATTLHYGYSFYFKDGSNVLTFPITPSELTIKVGSKNKVVTLINEGDINILKSPSLIDVEFEARFPMRKYPYSHEPEIFQVYHDWFKDLKENKRPFRFIVVRVTPSGVRTWDTNLLVALEDYELKESADEGDDVIVSFKLKQYKEYGVKVLKTIATETPTTSTSDKPRSSDTKPDTSKEYTVKSGDCLWNIAKQFYGDGSKWKVIYDANKTVIEDTAKKYGRKSSSNGHWIYPNTKLIIPNASGTKTGTVEKPESPPVKPPKSGNSTINVSVARGCERYGTVAIEYNNGSKIRTAYNTSVTISDAKIGSTATVMVHIKEPKYMGFFLCWLLTGKKSAKGEKIGEQYTYSFEVTDKSYDWIAKFKT